MKDLTIRKAKLADAEKLYEWHDKPHVKSAVSGSSTLFETNWQKELADRIDGVEFFIAEVATQNGRIAIGALLVIDPAHEQSHHWGAVAANQRAINIWVGEEQYLGKGYGTQMITYAIDYSFKLPHVVAILIDPIVSNRRSDNFYKKFGFEVIERRQFGVERHCPAFKLTRGAYNLRMQGQYETAGA